LSERRTTGLAVRDLNLRHLEPAQKRIGPDADGLGGFLDVPLRAVQLASSALDFTIPPARLSARRLDRTGFESFRLLCPEEKAHDDPP
jgi:hypothetical protein